MGRVKDAVKKATGRGKKPAAAKTAEKPQKNRVVTQSNVTVHLDRDPNDPRVNRLETKPKNKAANRKQEAKEAKAAEKLAKERANAKN